MSFTVGRLPLLSALLLSLPLAPVACSGDSGGSDVPSVPDHHDDGDGDGPTGEVSSALAPTATVAALLATSSCSTSAVNGLSVQLVNEIECLRPKTFMKIDKTPGLALGSAVMPYLQTKAAQGLIAVQKARGTTMSINSALRALPAQYILYSWYQTGRCGITLAAKPGTSNHEGGIAVDVNDNAGWRSAMQSHGFRWLGASDPVHYDYIGGGTVNLQGLSVTAFQRLWNRNHPADKIAVDGTYGPATQARIRQSPIGGFTLGADCSSPKPDAGVDAGPHGGDGGRDGSDADDDDGVPRVPDADPPGDDPAENDDANGTGTPSVSPEAPADDAGSCAVSTRGAPSDAPLALTLGMAAALALGSRRRRRATSEP